MKEFNGFQYLLIDVANHMGLDKLTFEDRIDWATQNLDQLESLVERAEAQPLYLKTCMAIRAAQRGEASGHLVAFDAVCSGIQIMSALTGCISGAKATGMVDPDRRADAYSEVTDEMNNVLHAGGNNAVTISRGDAKEATMTKFYGSKLVPKRIFGEDTPELDAFYQACSNVAPGASELLQSLLDSWQPYALVHEWRLPDGYLARVKVMDTVEQRLEVDELDHATFTYQYSENVGSERGLSNAANVVHSVDAYVLRSLVRRCNYDAVKVKAAAIAINIELIDRALGMQQAGVAPSDSQLGYYVEQYERSGMVDVIIFPYIDINSTCLLSTKHLKALVKIANQMLTYNPFPVITVHDAFSAHPNNVNQLRYWYKELMAELAESDLLSDILSQIHGSQGTYPKLSNQLPDLIRQSNYALS